MSYTREELLNRLARSHSWKEAQVSVSDVYEVLSQNAVDNTRRVPEGQTGIVRELRDKVKEQEETITQLSEKIKRLSDTNKQLRSENKSLRASR